MRPARRERGLRGRRARVPGRPLPRRLPRLTTVAVISDTHLPRGARRLPDECRRLLERSDRILHCGDLTGEEVLAELRLLGPVDAVLGNMDALALRDELPVERVVEIGAARIGMMHIPGPRAGREERLARRFPGCAAVIYGHTHEPDVGRYGETWILNPGSPTERRRAPTRAMLVLAVEGDAVSPSVVELP